MQLANDLDLKSKEIISLQEMIKANSEGQSSSSISADYKGMKAQIEELKKRVIELEAQANQSYQLKGKVEVLTDELRRVNAILEQKYEVIAELKAKIAVLEAKHQSVG